MKSKREKKKLLTRQMKTTTRFSCRHEHSMTQVRRIKYDLVLLLNRRGEDRQLASAQADERETGLESFRDSTPRKRKKAPFKHLFTHIVHRRRGMKKGAKERRGKAILIELHSVHARSMSGARNIRCWRALRTPTRHGQPPLPAFSKRPKEE